MSASLSEMLKYGAPPRGPNPQRYQRRVECLRHRVAGRNLSRAAQRSHYLGRADIAAWLAQCLAA